MHHTIFSQIENLQLGCSMNIYHFGNVWVTVHLSCTITDGPQQNALLGTMDFRCTSCHGLPSRQPLER